MTLGEFEPQTLQIIFKLLKIAIKLQILSSGPYISLLTWCPSFPTPIYVDLECFHTCGGSQKGQFLCYFLHFVFILQDLKVQNNEELIHVQPFSKRETKGIFSKLVRAFITLFSFIYWLILWSLSDILHVGLRYFFCNLFHLNQ